MWGNIFRRHDLSGLGKTGWFISTLVLPFLGVFIYVITQNDGMNQRNLERARAQRAQMDDYVRSTAGEGWRRRCGRDREGEAVVGQRRDHASRVRRAQAEGAGLRSTFVWAGCPSLAAFMIGRGR